MGTNVTLWLWTADERGAAQAAEAVFNEMKRLDQVMTTWDPRSEVSQINAAAGDKAVKVSAETYAVIARALDISKRSNGVFDITVEAFKGLWKFDEDRTTPCPTPTRSRGASRWSTGGTSWSMPGSAACSCAARACGSRSAGSPRATRSTGAPGCCARAASPAS